MVRNLASRSCRRIRAWGEGCCSQNTTSVDAAKGRPLLGGDATFERLREPTAIQRRALGLWELATPLRLQQSGIAVAESQRGGSGCARAEIAQFSLGDAHP